MKIQFAVVVSVLVAATTLCAAEHSTFDTAWITSKPEVLTYQSKSKQGDGLYQVSVLRTKDGIEVYMNIITPGFTKSVWGAMTSNMHPTESKSRIIVSGQIAMTTDCSYQGNSVHVTTLLAPGERVVENTLSNPGMVVDFSQTPLLARTLPLQPGAAFEFASLNPQNNSIVPMTIKVVGEETVQQIDCFKVEVRDFEGASTYWIEKEGPHRAVRIEQPATGRVTELIR